MRQAFDVVVNQELDGGRLFVQLFLSHFVGGYEVVAGQSEEIFQLHLN